MMRFGIDATAVEQAIRLSEGKYCSVGAMIKRSAVLDTSYEIHEERESSVKPLPVEVAV